MTLCVKGPWSHRSPLEDAAGAYREEHGITLLFAPAAPLSEYLDAESVQESIRRALVARRDTPRCDMAAIAADLGTSIGLLLPAGRAAADRMWRGSIHRTLLSTRLDSIKRQAGRGLGDDGPTEATNRLRQLAFDCPWLWTRYSPHITDQSWAGLPAPAHRRSTPARAGSTAARDARPESGRAPGGGPQRLSASARRQPQRPRRPAPGAPGASTPSPPQQLRFDPAVVPRICTKR